ncbi:restriction endonuclease subunit S, partial [Salmonella enterica subsp. enterica serovar Senftenberg]|nr:restriction endonuclease subunit S [Salmonella enterica subsp. enterica serovar Senftenberg]
EVRAYVRPELKGNLRLARTGDLVIAATGENVKDVCKAVAWLGADEIAIHDDCYIYRHSMDPKFVSYFFQSSAFQEQKTMFATESKLARISGANLAKIKVPVPPAAVQREIVKILDKMEMLKAELEAELEYRTRQYAYYRRVILDQVQADVVPLSSLGKWQGGITPSKANSAYWESGTIPWLASMDVSNTSTDEIRGRITDLALSETSVRLVPAPSVAVVMRSNILRRTLPIGLIKVDTTVNQDMRVLVPREGVNAEYVFQVLRADAERIRSACVRTDGSMAAVDSQGFFGWDIPLPSLAEQRRVAKKLRHFDALVNDLSIGLPAEIAARRQQYEYYRDMLLTFKEAA